jgi:hypothetical protein
MIVLPSFLHLLHDSFSIFMVGGIVKYITDLRLEREGNKMLLILIFHAILL